MDDIILMEHHTAGPFTLTPHEVSSLLRIPRQPVKLQSVGNDWQLIASSLVGSVRLASGRNLVVRPKVPNDNLLWMLASQYELAQWLGLQYLNADQFAEVMDLYMYVLLEWLDLLHKRGMFHAYYLVEAELPRVKGRYKVPRNPADTSRFRCEFDEHSPDVLINRVIRSTLRAAMSLPLKPALRQRVRESYRRLEGIVEVRLSDVTFHQFSFHRLNRHYRPIVALCHLIYRSGNLNEQGGSEAFSGFFVDMNRLFEDFIRSELKKRLAGEIVKKTIATQWAEPLQPTNHLPALIPDILVENRMVLDTKYYSSPVRNGVLHSAHLYQLAMYCRAFRLDGLLVYPENESVFNEKYHFQGLNLGVKTVKLHGSRQALIESVDELAQKIRSVQPIDMQKSSEAL